MEHPSTSKTNRVSTQTTHKPSDQYGKGPPATFRRSSLEYAATAASRNVIISTPRNAALFCAACATLLPAGPTNGRIMHRKKNESPEATAMVVPKSGLDNIPSVRGWSCLSIGFPLVKVTTNIRRSPEGWKKNQRGSPMPHIDSPRLFRLTFAHLSCCLPFPFIGGDWFRRVG